ncbi:MAG: hypothetical protein C4547_12550 [Phycisphaerales bacterium]|nr:MAG: hypothetical protein C4547_12550 [Phycisphaerales bacterium]
MQRTYLGLMGVAAMLWASASAQADLYDSPATYRIRITQDTNGYAMGNAGEFTIENAPTPPGENLPASVVFGAASDKNGTSFQTFCVEYSEHINPPANYWADITEYATGGNGGWDGNKGPGGSHSDDLSYGTAYLYTQFRTGALFSAGYQSAPSFARENDARALQIAIWLLEGERTEGQLAGETNLAQGKIWRDQAVSAVANNVWTAGLGNVRVLNLWGDAGRTEFRQDQLIMIPAPGAALLATLGLAMVGFVRRRFA